MKITKCIQIILIPVLLFLFAATLSAQHVEGTVYNENGEAMYGATVQWKGANEGTFTDTTGYFVLPRRHDTDTLKINYVGYNPVFIEVLPGEKLLEVSISGITDLAPVEVVEREIGNYTSTLETVNTEFISACELRKAPCCNLAESFETNATVDLTAGNAVLGNREIQMLGLRGIYTQMLLENRPVYSGLSYPYALEYIPGTWIENIQISKGSGSNMNGTAGIAGQINTELIKPFKGNRYFVNLFRNSIGRTELNLQSNQKLDEKWSTSLFVHGSILENEVDRNDDGFLDVPKKQQVNGLYRLFHRGEKIFGQFNVQYVKEKREGGQAPSYGPERFLMDQDIDRVSLFGKFAFLGFEELWRNLVFIGSYDYHHNDAQYGYRNYMARQEHLFSNLLYTSKIGTEQHELVSGLSYEEKHIEESLSQLDFDRTERNVGALLEYQYRPDSIPDKKLSLAWMLSARVDHHNLFDWYVTPRANLRVNFGAERVLRLSAGLGYKTAYALAENLGVLASNRVLTFEQQNLQEKAFNAGLNYTQNISWGNRRVLLNLDLYHTEFENQLVLNLDNDPTQGLFQALDGRSYSTYFLLSSSIIWDSGFEVKGAYKWNHVRQTLDDELRDRILVPRHKALLSLDYNWDERGWLFNWTTQYTGTARLPENTQYPDDILEDRPGQSPDYVTMNLQVTKLLGKWEIYGGVENLTDFTQDNPIIASENPESPFFDASQIYAPILGRRFNLGVRFIVE